MNAVLLIGAGVLGAIVGSFLNVVIYRLPAGEFWKKGSRSVCPACGVRIPARHNVPVFSWLLLGGRARCCGARISPRYFVVEVLTAGLFLAVWQWPPSGYAFRVDHPDPTGLLAFAFHAWFLAALVAASFIDIDHRILPDAITKSTMVVGCVGALLVPGLAGRFELPGALPGLDSLLFSLVGMATGAGLTYAIRASAGIVFRKPAMGLGDVKLMGAIGAFLGWERVLMAFFLGCLLGAVVGMVHRRVTGDPYIFFGPFLALGAVLALFGSKALLHGLEALQEWQRTTREAPWIVGSAGLLSIVLLFVLVRRGRAT